MKPKRALIFDLDDTLVATGGSWHKAQWDLLAAMGVDAAPDLALSQQNGRSARDIVKNLHAQFLPPISLAACEELFVASLILHVGRDMTPKPGAVEMVHDTYGQWRLAVASGSPGRLIFQVVDRMRLASYFDALISSEEVGKGKPSPALFLETARRLEVEPRCCVVIEDSLAGVEAAQAAGMRCVAVPSHPGEKQSIAVLADAVVDNLAAARQAVARMAQTTL